MTRTLILLLALTALCSCRSGVRPPCTWVYPCERPCAIPDPVCIEIGDDYLITEYDNCPAEGCPWRIIMHKGARAKLEMASPSTLRRLDFGQSLTLEDLRELSAQGFPEEAIQYQLARTETKLSLTPQQLSQLHQGGVRPSVIEYLQSN